jgi:hypothetical protein
MQLIYLGCLVFYAGNVVSVGKIDVKADEIIKLALSNRTAPK